MKLFELTEGYWKNIDIARQEGRWKPPEEVAPAPQMFHVLVNGKVWKKEGQPVEFTDQGKAAKAATTISNRYNKVTQVIPAKSKKS